MHIQPELASAIIDVISELAMELDLHYEDDELVAVAPTFEKVDHLVHFLKVSGYEPPPVYEHVRKRYHQGLH
ncbi:hypothetical protein [Rhizobium arsenicireducens]